MKILFYYNSVYHAGIAQLSSFLKFHGHTTELLFDPAIGSNHYINLPFLNTFISKKLLIEKAKRFNPDLVAFSFVTNQFQDVIEIGKLLKMELKVPFIAGGIHPTILPDEVIKEDWLDILCIGEGEEALLELANNLEQKKDISNIQNLWVKNNDGTITKNPLRPLIKDLDTLPFCDMELFDKYGLIYSRIDIFTGRGCMNSCSFCINSFKNKLFQSKQFLRRRSVDNVIEEMILIEKKYNPRQYRFLDDTFAYDSNWLKNFAREYSMKINKPYRCTVHPGIATPEIIELLGKSNCKSVTMGFQSASPRIRSEIMNRHYSNEKVADIACCMKKNKIKLSIDLIFGMPTETPLEMWETLDICDKIDITSITPSFFYPFPNTTLTNYCLEHNFINQQTYQKIIKGVGSYHTTFLLDHPYRDEVMKFQAVIAMYNKVPLFLKKFLRRILKWKYGRTHRLFHFLSVPFNEFYEFRRRILMIPFSLIKTRRVLMKKD